LEGEITGFNNIMFSQILFNNLFLVFNTFVTSSLFLLALIFVVVWNASILAYYLYSLSSHSNAAVTFLNVLVHALLEIGGYVWAGLLGAILSYRFSIYFIGYGGFSNINRKKVLNKTFAIDCLTLFCLCISFIFLAAVVEVL
jgi:uncharacterized membrane protein SpoIIM required for sporulation